MQAKPKGLFIRSEHQHFSMNQEEEWEEDPPLRYEIESDCEMEQFDEESYTSPPPIRKSVATVPPPPPIRKPNFGNFNQARPPRENRPIGTFYARDNFRLWRTEGIVSDGNFVSTSTPSKVTFGSRPLSVLDNIPPPPFSGF